MASCEMCAGLSFSYAFDGSKAGGSNYTPMNTNPNPRASGAEQSEQRLWYYLITLLSCGTQVLSRKELIGRSCRLRELYEKTYGSLIISSCFPLKNKSKSLLSGICLRNCF